MEDKNLFKIVILDEGDSVRVQTTNVSIADLIEHAIPALVKSCMGRAETEQQLSEIRMFLLASVNNTLVDYTKTEEPKNG